MKTSTNTVITAFLSINGLKCTKGCKGVFISIFSCSAAFKVIKSQKNLKKLYRVSYYILTARKYYCSK